MRLRAELRARWRPWLGLALLIGLGGGAAAAAAAGARRAETAYPRFVEAHKGYDLVTGGFPGSIDPERALARMAALPQVLEWARVDVVAYAGILPSGRQVSIPELFAVTDLSGRAGFRINRFKLVSGRLADPDASDQAMVDFPIADRKGLKVGSRIRFVVGDPGAERPTFAAVRIVGIVASPGQFPAVGASSGLGAVYVTPAFARANRITPSPADASLLIRLRRGAADRDAFIRDKAAAGLGAVDVPAVQQVQTAGVQRSIRLESQALWVLSALIALAALAILGQALARQTWVESAEFPALRALGMSRPQLAALGVLRAVVIGAVAACLAVPVAVLLSPLTPIGLARIAEPDPGFAADPFPLAVGAGAVLLLTVLAAVPASTAAAAASAAPASVEAGPRRSSTVVGTLGRVWRSPAAAAGVRMALAPGRGRTAVPVRSTVFGATLGVAALTASLVFAASLAHLLATPRLSGYTWDALVGVEGEQAQAAAALRADPRVAGYTLGGFGNVKIGGAELMALTVDGSGPARPVITEGAAPAADDEIALGAATMRATHSAIGRSVDVVLDQAQGPPPKPIRMRVVGTVIVPPNPFAATTLGEGAAVTLSGWRRIDPHTAEQPEALPFLVRFAPGVNRDAGLAAVVDDLKRFRPSIYPAEQPGNVTSLARIANVPVLLAALLALLAVGMFAHTLVSSTRRRRRDLAVLKTLGFVRRQLHGTVAWQASTLVAIALAIGLPAGIAGGRWGWRLFAQQLGVLPDPVVPLVAVLLAVPAALVLANLVAVLPGRAAGRTHAAVVLRSE
jgi:ABC-type lipoprotein release transport system permease subunit